MRNFFSSFQKIAKQFLTQKNLLYLVSLPLFVNWYIVLLFYYEDHTLKKQCFRSAYLTLGFFLTLFISWVFSKIPFFGPLFGNFIHLGGVLIYVGISFFFIYKIYMNQELVIEVLEQQVKNLEKFFI